MWPNHTLGFHSATKRKAILAHAARWVNLEAFVRSKKSQTPKDTRSMIAHILETF